MAISGNGIGPETNRRIIQLQDRYLQGQYLSDDGVNFMKENNPKFKIEWDIFKYANSQEGLNLEENGYGFYQFITDPKYVDIRGEDSKTWEYWMNCFDTLVLESAQGSSLSPPPLNSYNL